MAMLQHNQNCMSQGNADPPMYVSRYCHRSTHVCHMVLSQIHPCMLQATVTDLPMYAARYCHRSTHVGHKVMSHLNGCHTSIAGCQKVMSLTQCWMSQSDVKDPPLNHECHNVMSQIHHWMWHGNVTDTGQSQDVTRYCHGSIHIRVQGSITDPSMDITR